jgi:hypothetical protein
MHFPGPDSVTGAHFCECGETETGDALVCAIRPESSREPSGRSSQQPGVFPPRLPARNS